MELELDFTLETHGVWRLRKFFMGFKHCQHNLLHRVATQWRLLHNVQLEEEEVN